MSAEDDIADALTRHQIFVLRYARGREREAEDFVSRTLLSVISRLEDDDLTTLSRERYQDKARDLYQYLRASNSDYADEFLDEMRRFAGYESDFNTSLGQKHLDTDFNRPAPLQLQQAIFADIMGLEPTQGYTIRGMLDQYGRQGANLVVDQIRESITLGETTQQLTSKIRSLIPTQQRKAATVARTAVNHVAVQARKESMKENDDVLDGYKWLATLDSRTSMICMARDGTIYKDYDKDPKPPAHFNCRSTITYIVKPEFDIGADIVGTRPAKGSGGAKSVKANLTYDDWLRKQSKAFQISVLGKSRAQLFRDGLTLDRFVDNRGNMLTLEQLSDMDFEFSGVSVEQLVADIPIVESSFDLSLKFSASSATAQEYQDKLFSQTSDRTEAVIRKALLPKITDTRGKGAIYDAWEREINCSIDRGRGLSFIHEYGHHIDSTIGRTNPNKDKVRLFASEHDELFLKAFEMDRKALGLHRRNTKWEKLEEVRAEMAELVTETKTMPSGRTITLKNWNVKDDYYTQMMDIFDALTHGDASENLAFSGHGRSYYKHKGNRYAETFAQLFSLDGAPKHVRDNVDRWFPNLKRRFHEILDDYIKNGVRTYDG